MTLSRRAFLASLGSLSASAAWAQTPPTSDALVRLAGSCILGGSRAPRLHPTLARMLSDQALAGILVSNENFSSFDSLRAVIRGTSARVATGAPPFLIAADQEGGTVSHLSPALPRMPSVHELGQLDDPALTQRWGAAMGASLRAAGVNFDLAPVLDVRTNPANMVVYLRTFGTRPEVVARHARPVVEGLLGAGVQPCAKHFPGHGDTTMDSHQGLPRVRHDLARLESVELVPFRAVIDIVPAVMLAHVVYTGVDAAMPATLSRAIAHDLLRERLNFRGVTVSDDLEMSAIRRRWGVTDGSLRAMSAGCDLLLIAHTPGLALESARLLARRAEVDTAFRARLEEASGRVRALRERIGLPTPAGAVADTPARVTREVLRRSLARGRRPQRPERDPTRG